MLTHEFKKFNTNIGFRTTNNIGSILSRQQNIDNTKLVKKSGIYKLS